MGLYIEVQYRGDWWGEEPIHETQAETTGDLYRMLTGQKGFGMFGNIRESMGRCTGKVYVDTPDGDAEQVGWIFVARNPEPVNRGDTQPTGLREAWVTVYDAEPTVVRTDYPHKFGKVTQ